MADFSFTFFFLKYSTTFQVYLDAHLTALCSSGALKISSVISIVFEESSWRDTVDRQWRSKEEWQTGQMINEFSSFKHDGEEQHLQGWLNVTFLNGEFANKICIPTSTLKIK